MGTTSVFEGRPVSGIAMNLVYGSLVFAMGLLFVVVEAGAVLRTPVVLVPMTFFLGLGGLFLGQAANGLRGRRLEVGDRGVRFLVGGRARWEVPWEALRAIGTTALGGRYPRAGFYLRAAGATRHVNTRDHLGPRSLLKQAFHEIVHRAEGRGVTLEDLLGWATDHAPAFAPARGADSPPAPEGRWHGTTDLALLSPFWGISFVAVANGIALVLIAASGVVSGRARDGFGLGGGMILLLGGVFAFAVWGIRRTTARAVRVRVEGIDLRFPSGKIVKVPWERVDRCGFNPTTGTLVIWSSASLLRGWVAHVPAPVGHSVVRRLAEFRASEARGEPAWWTVMRRWAEILREDP